MTGDTIQQFTFNMKIFKMYTFSIIFILNKPVSENNQS
jgi:hypothetical protein